MRIIAKKTLRDFWEARPDAEQPLKAWHARVKSKDWKISSDIKQDYGNASFLADNRIIFNIKGNTYRLVTIVAYDFGIIYIRFIGTHAEYDRIDAAII